MKQSECYRKSEKQEFAGVDFILKKIGFKLLQKILPQNSI